MHIGRLLVRHSIQSGGGAVRRISFAARTDQPSRTSIFKNSSGLRYGRTGEIRNGGRAEKFFIRAQSLFALESIHSFLHYFYAPLHTGRSTRASQAGMPRKGGPNLREKMMEDFDSTSFDKLSKLASELKEIEDREGGVKDPARADEVREGLIAAMRGVYKSHYDFAVWLDRYRKLYKAKKTTTAAMERIATTYGCSSRTLYRLLSNFEDAKQLPLVFVDVMQDEGIDPVRTENQPLVKTLAAAPKPADREGAKAALNAARTNLVKMKPAVQSARSELEDFATRIVRMFEAQYGSYHGADRDEQIRFVLERVVNVLGADVHELRTYDRPDRVPKPGKGTC